MSRRIQQDAPTIFALDYQRLYDLMTAEEIVMCVICDPRFRLPLRCQNSRVRMAEAFALRDSMIRPMSVDRRRREWADRPPITAELLDEMNPAA